MNRKVKLLLWGLILGFVGMAVAFGVIMGTGSLMSREAESVYTIDEPFETVVLDIGQADVSLVPTDGTSTVGASIKAWRPEPINIDTVIGVRVEGGVLTITETPFPNDFLGVFAQPYELKLTIRIPEDIDVTIRGDEP